jgi:hypothetical protein
LKNNVGILEAVFHQGIKRKVEKNSYLLKEKKNWSALLSEVLS